MGSENIDIDSAVESLVKDRKKTGHALRSAVFQAEEKRAALAAAEKGVAAAWDAAIKAGWTARELERVGFSRPASKRGGRSRGASRKAAQPQRTVGRSSDGGVEA